MCVYIYIYIYIYIYTHTKLLHRPGGLPPGPPAPARHGGRGRAGSATYIQSTIYERYTCSKMNDIHQACSTFNDTNNVHESSHEI